MDKQTCARQILQEFFFSKVQVTDDSTQLFVAGQSISNFADDIGWCLLSVHGKWVKQSKDQDQEENGVESFGPTGATVWHEACYCANQHFESTASPVCFLSAQLLPVLLQQSLPGESVSVCQLASLSQYGHWCLQSRPCSTQLSR